MNARLLAAVLLVWPAGALAQEIPADVPSDIWISMERPDVPEPRFLMLHLETESGVTRLSGCESRVADSACTRTRGTRVSPSQLAELRTRWRALAAGARCRIQRPDGTWRPFRLGFGAQELEGMVYERADAGLSARCFAMERVGGWFLRVWQGI